MKFESTSSRKAWLAIGSIILSLLSFAGCFFDISPESSNIVSFILENTSSFLIICTILFLGYYHFVPKLFQKIDSWSNSNDCEPSKRKVLKASKKNWLLYSGLLLICWLPYLAICFPGTVAGLDYFWQLMQGCGAMPLSNHHPVFGSLVFGCLYRFGYAIGGAAGGIFATSLFQMLLMALVLGFCLAILREQGVGRAYVIFAVAFFGICPVYPLHAMWAVKDSIFSSIMILFCFGFYLHVWGSTYNVKVPAVASMPALVALAFFFSVYRNGVFVIAIIILVCVICIDWKAGGRDKKRVLRGVASVAALLILIGGWNLCLDKMNVYPTNMTESVAIPGRQILKTYEKRSESFSDSEIKELKYIYRSSIAHGRTLENIVSANDYRTADYIKPTPFEGRGDIVRYISYWAKLGIRNPDIYVNEALRGSYAYWWPGYNPSNAYHVTPGWTIQSFFKGYDFDNKLVKEYFGPLVASLGNNREILNQTMEQHLRQYPEIHDYTQLRNSNEGLMVKFLTTIGHIKTIPLISILLAPGFYAWIAFLCLGYLFSRKYPGRHLWPILLIIVLACLSPVNGYARYVLPIYIFAILLIGICLTKNGMKGKQGCSSIVSLQD